VAREWYLHILLGIVGAIVRGWLFHLFGAVGVTQLNLYSLIVAIIGAVVVRLVYHMIRRGVVGRRISLARIPRRSSEQRVREE
jgi:uncharacterized membrane protein YeaQ/YmgE (transglycosylase-associated protein family)